MAGKWDMYKGMVGAQLNTLPATDVKGWIESLFEFVQLGIICYICVTLRIYWAVAILLALVVLMGVVAWRSGDLKRTK